MNPLLLSGWGVKVSVEGLKSASELTVTDGREDTRQHVTMRFRPRRFSYDSIVVDGYSGYLSLRAVHWLSRNQIPVYILDVDGSLLSTILPSMPLKANLRVEQVHAIDDQEKRFSIAHALVKAKIVRSLQVLDWLAQRYDVEHQIRLAKREAAKLGNAQTVSQIRTVEGRVALRYWETFRMALPESLSFAGRMTTTHQNNASDPFNAALNFGYGILQGEVRRAVNSVGLEPSLGFLHEFSDYQTKQSLVYDLMEPFRWLIDLVVFQSFESEGLNWKSFYFTGDDYRYRFTFEAKKRFVEALRERFNAGVSHRGRVLKWNTVIEEKTRGLGRFLTGKSCKLDFEEPVSNLERQDDKELRARILTLTASEARRAGIGKSTLHYLRKNARGRAVFKLYEPLKRRLVVGPA
jgi:CRISPR-associated protein Cas1